MIKITLNKYNDLIMTNSIADLGVQSPDSLLGIIISFVLQIVCFS